MKTTHPNALQQWSSTEGDLFCSPGGHGAVWKRVWLPQLLGGGSVGGGAPLAFSG